MNKAKIKSWLLWFFNSFIWLAVLFFVVDLVTKLVVVANRDYILSRPGGQGIDLIPGFLAINYVENPGMAFGLGSDNDVVNRWIFVTVATIGTAIITIIYVKKFKQLNRITRACLMLMLVGAVGNLVDRLFYSFSDFKVVDWINFYGIWSWNFNIADSCIVVGTIILIIYLVINEVKENRKKELAENQQPANNKNTDSDSK
jgi:signal peptidase II